MSIETQIRGADGLATAIGDPASVGGLAATDHGPSVVQVDTRRVRREEVRQMNIEMLMSGAATYTPLPDVAAAPHAEAPAGTAGATEMIATWGVKFAEWVVGLL